MVIDGFSGRDISESYSLPGQQEVVHLPGAKLRITDVRTANDGNPLIYAKEVLTNGKDMATDSERDGQSTTRANKKGQAGNVEGKGNDRGGVFGIQGVSDGGKELGGVQIQQSGSLSKGVKNKLPVGEGTDQRQDGKAALSRYRDEVRGLSDDVAIMEKEFARIARGPLRPRLAAAARRILRLRI